ncbi:MAG: hypothetical protein A4E66_02145 [Syntrophus sp. PtaB.Bin001]|nr:MAG: hypothetical protein A4E66_02145 [Syntrophus sp. PtaB.Bin001]
MNKKSFLFLVAMIIFLSSCALNNHTIQTPYQPTLHKIEGSEKYSVFTKVDYQPVFQNDPKAVGVKKNGYGFETARIYMAENVEDWLKKAFDKELKSAGLDVVNSQNNNAIKITLDVRQIFVEPWVGFWSCDVIGILKIEVKLDSPNKDSYFIRKFVTYDKLTTIVWLDSMHETRIINVVQKTIPEIVKEINLLLASNS